MKKFALSFLFLVSCLIWTGGQIAMAAGPGSCTFLQGFSFNVDRIEFGAKSKISGVVPGSKTIFEYNIVSIDEFAGQGEVQYNSKIYNRMGSEAGFAEDRTIDFEFIGSYAFSGWVQEPGGKPFHTKLATPNGVIFYNGHSFTTDPGTTITMFTGSDEELKYVIVPGSFGFLGEGYVQGGLDPDKSKFTQNFEKFNLTDYYPDTAFVSACKDTNPGTYHLVDYQVNIIFDDTDGIEKIVFSSSQYTISCVVPDGYKLDSFLESQSPEGVVSPGVLSHFFAIPEVGDECIVTDPDGDILQFMGTSMATPAYR